jgi:hypothetical protein
MINRYREIECDSCGVANDGDPMNFIGTTESYGITNRVKLQELQAFWLCGDCKTEYPQGAKDFFTEDFFDVQSYCIECDVEEVEADGHVCDDCEADA